MTSAKKIQEAFTRFDAANQKDPNSEVYEGITYPKELLYSYRMTEQLNNFAKDASIALQLSARCQHICRWKIARNTYEMNRNGYLRWRQELNKFHAKKAVAILIEVGYSEDIIKSVKFLLEKNKSKRTQKLKF